MATGDDYIYMLDEEVRLSLRNWHDEQRRVRIMSMGEFMTKAFPVELALSQARDEGDFFFQIGILSQKISRLISAKCKVSLWGA